MELTDSWLQRVMQHGDTASDIVAWLEEHELSRVYGLLPAILAVAPDLKALTSLDDEILSAAVETVKLNPKGAKYKRLMLALATIRVAVGPNKRQPLKDLASEPKATRPSRVRRKPISAAVVEDEPAAEAPPLSSLHATLDGAHPHTEAQELSDLAALLSSGNRSSSRPDSADVAKKAALAARTLSCPLSSASTRHGSLVGSVSPVPLSFDDEPTLVPTDPGDVLAASQPGQRGTSNGCPPGEVTCAISQPRSEKRKRRKKKSSNSPRFTPASTGQTPPKKGKKRSGPTFTKSSLTDSLPPPKSPAAHSPVLHPQARAMRSAACGTPPTPHGDSDDKENAPANGALLRARASRINKDSDTRRVHFADAMQDAGTSW